MKKKSILILLPLLFFASCGAEDSGAPSKEVGGYQTESSESGTNSSIVIDTTAKIIYTVDYSVVTEDIQAMTSSVRTKTYDLGGYIENSTESYTYSNVVYRIPTDKLDLFVDYIDSFEGINNKNISTQDVSSTYSEIEARIKVLTDSKAAYNQYIEDNENTLTLQEKLVIYDKISSIDTELSKYNYQKDKLDGKLNYSTVTIRYNRESTYEEPGWFETYFKYVGDFFVGFGKALLYLLPIGLVGGVIFAAIFVPIKIKKKKNNK